MTFSFVISVHMEQLGSHGTDFHEIWYWRIFRKSVKKIQVSLILDKNNGYFTWRHCTFFIISCSILLRMKNISDKSYRETRNTHFMFNNFFFGKSCRLWDNVEKYCRAGHPQMKIWCMHISCWILKATKCTHRLYNTHCFSTAAVVARTHLNVTLYVHCLSCKT